jgi:hypothetical protein
MPDFQNEEAGCLIEYPQLIRVMMIAPFMTRLPSYLNCRYQQQEYDLVPDSGHQNLAPCDSREIIISHIRFVGKKGSTQRP